MEHSATALSTRYPSSYTFPPKLQSSKAPKLQSSKAPKLQSSTGKPVSRSKLHEEISHAGYKLGLNLSTHSMRKSKPTIGYEDGADIAVISKALGHKSLSSNAAR
ncbi:tyrosine-type recombinase/integrase [Serratia sp. NA_13]|uniref:tyrosine-type recombinase/integrase n=1 Tax=Serratia sp. NA_13 TaxID=3415658 RepID=UPI0040468A8A